MFRSNSYSFLIAIFEKPVTMMRRRGVVPPSPRSERHVIWPAVAPQPRVFHVRAQLDGKAITASIKVGASGTAGGQQGGRQAFSKVAPFVVRQKAGEGEIKAMR